MSDLLGELSNFRSNIRRQVEISSSQKQSCGQKLHIQDLKSSVSLSQKQFVSSRGSSTSFLDCKKKQLQENNQMINQIQSLKKLVMPNTIQRNNSTQKWQEKETFDTFAEKMSQKMQIQQDIREPPKLIQILKEQNQRSEAKYTHKPDGNFFQKYLMNKQQREEIMNSNLNQSSCSSKENQSFSNQSVVLNSNNTNFNQKQSLTSVFPKDDRDDRSMSEQITMQQLQKIQDVLIDSSDNQFDRLNVKYVEELIKLSSVIMYRVKNSKFYKQDD